MPRLASLLLLAAVALVAVGCGGTSPPEPTAPARAPLTSATLRGAVTAPAIVAHLRRLEAIAREHGGNRAAGTRGADASIEYVAGRLRRAGYRVTEQRVPFPYFDERAKPVVAIGARELDGIRTLAYSSGATVEAPLALVPALGCERSDFAGLERGSVALLQRGTCTLRSKAERAQAAGARAVLIVNGEAGTFAGTLGRPGVRVPVVGTSPETGRALRAAAGDPVRVVVDAVSEERTTRNVIAETRAGRRDGAVMLGAHLDSVEDGPGINDNGTGSASLLEVAERLAELRAPDRRVRFAFWGAEELGLHGSRRYVRSLSRTGRREIAAYVNLDMTGSPNPVREVYDSAAYPAGSDRIERALRSHFRARGLPVGETPIRGGSDHAPFAAAGIPVGGLFTGASERKTRVQARSFGGRAGRRLDPCYHRACDTVANVDPRVLGQMADAAAHAVAELSVSPRGRAGRAAAP